jgi:hypothetical protein
MFKITKIFIELKEKTESIGLRVVMLSGGRILIIFLSIGMLSLFFTFTIRTLNQALFIEPNFSSVPTELFHLSKLKAVASYWEIENESLLIKEDNEIED